MFGIWTGAVVTALLVHACGSRTGLLTPEPVPDAATDVTLRDAPLGDSPPAADVLVPHCAAHTCASSGYACGANGDGCGDLLQCGACPEPEICGVGGYSECGGGQGLGPDGGPLCSPRTCATLGFNCGPAADG
jgi:hypothetical protein